MVELEICLQAFKWWHFAAKISTFQWNRYIEKIKICSFYESSTIFWMARHTFDFTSLTHSKSKRGQLSYVSCIAPFTFHFTLLEFIFLNLTKESMATIFFLFFYINGEYIVRLATELATVSKQASSGTSPSLFDDKNWLNCTILSTKCHRACATDYR